MGASVCRHRKGEPGGCIETFAVFHLHPPDVYVSVGVAARGEMRGEMRGETREEMGCPAYFRDVCIRVPKHVTMHIHIRNYAKIHACTTNTHPHTTIPTQQHPRTSKHSSTDSLMMKSEDRLSLLSKSLLSATNSLFAACVCRGVFCVCWCCVRGVCFV